MVRRTVILGILLVMVLVDILTAVPLYCFRRSKDYEELSDEDRIKLEIVHRDFLMLWGALDMYADQNGGKCPRTLKALVPDYLLELPRDPFATDETAKTKRPRGYKPSVNGYGYWYKQGAVGNRAWCLESVGLPKFPYYTSSARPGLYLYKGVWVNGVNKVKDQEDFKEISTEKEYASPSERAVAVARAWLKLVDEGRYKEGWEAGALYFRVLIPFERWRKVIHASRKENGKVISRKLDSTEQVPSIPGAPEGEYIVVKFKTDYWDKKNAVETVVTTRDSDGVWRVSGYSID